MSNMEQRNKQAQQVSFGVEDRIKMLIGHQVVQIAALTAELEAAKKTIEDLRSKLASSEIFEEKEE